MSDIEDIKNALEGLAGPRKVSFAINVMILRVGTRYVGTGELAGQVFRGNPAAEPIEAARSLLMQLTQGVNMDASLALDLAAAGESTETMTASLRAALSSDGGATKAAPMIDPADD